MKESLVYILRNSGAIKFGDFRQTSGKMTNYYVDMRTVVTKPMLLSKVAHEIISAMTFHNIKTDYIGCHELTGIPLGTMVSTYTGLPLIIVRKERKEHGTKERLVGEFEKGKSVVLVDDVIATGGSVLKSIKALKEEGLTIEHVIAVVDREEGALEKLTKEGLTLLSLLKIGDLVKRYDLKNI